jgi:hypothetical protein
MKINSKDFRVREGHEVDLKKWPTKVDPQGPIYFRSTSGSLAKLTANRRASSLVSRFAASRRPVPSSK